MHILTHTYAHTPFFLNMCTSDTIHSEFYMKDHLMRPTLFKTRFLHCSVQSCTEVYNLALHHSSDTNTWLMPIVVFWHDVPLYMKLMVSTVKLSHVWLSKKPRHVQHSKNPGVSSIYVKPRNVKLMVSTVKPRYVKLVEKKPQACQTDGIHCKTQACQADVKPRHVKLM